MSFRAKVPRSNDPLGIGLKSVPETLQRLWLVWEGNPFFEEDSRQARRDLDVPADGFRDVALFTDWSAPRRKRHGHDDRLGQGRIFLQIGDHKLADDETLIRHLAKKVNWGPDARVAPTPCCPSDPLYLAASGLAGRYGIDEAQAEPGFESIIEDVAVWLLFNRWRRHRSLRGSRSPILETTQQTSGSRRSIVLNRFREERVGLNSRGGEGGTLPMWRQWWELRSGGASLQEIVIWTEEHFQQEFDDRSVQHGIDSVGKLMRPLLKN